MIGKIVTGKSFKGAVEYVMNKPGARLLACDGVDAADAGSLTRSFDFQRKARPEKAQVVGHVSLSFHPDDGPRLTDEFMAELAREYMRRMNMTDTQYIVVRHHDTEHPHVHIIYNRVKYDAKLVRSHNERIRNVAVCKAIKQQYGLTFSEGKQRVKTEKLHGPDRVKYAIYGAVEEALPRCLSVEALAEALQRQGIATTFVHRSGDPAKEVQGLTFSKDNVTFKASQVDRKFSYGNLKKQIEANRIEAEAAARHAEQQRRRVQADEQRRQRGREAARQRKEERVRQAQRDFRKLWAQRHSDGSGAKHREPEQAQALGRSPEKPKIPPRQSVREREMPRPAASQDNTSAEHPRARIAEIRGRRLTPQEQRQLYSPQGLTLTYRKEDIEYTKLYRLLTPEGGPDMLTEQPLSQRRIDSNPVVYGARLSDEQVLRIRQGEYIRLEGMQREDGTLFSGYLVMDDRLTEGWIFRQPPERIVEEGKFYIREMDKLLADHGYVVRAEVRFRGETQPESRQYFWKNRHGDYDCSPDDPRMPKPEPPRREIHVPSIPPLKKSKGQKL